MSIDVDKALENLAKRRTDPQSGKVVLSEKVAKSRPFEKMASGLRIGSYLESIFESIDQEYLRVTLEQALRIQSPLQKMAKDQNLSLEFEFQGSVTNGTAIKVSSDVDLLAICGHFVTLDRGIPNPNPFLGDVLEELRRLRSSCQHAITNAFPKADVDSSGGKAISISGGSLTRKVDIVPSNWHNSLDYIQNNNDRVFRGIRVLDVRNNVLVKNFPFLHNALVGIKDHKTDGKYTGLVRAVKNIRDDAIDAGIKIPHMSSYFITSLIYHIPDQLFAETKSEIGLLLEFCKFSLNLLKESEQKTRLMVPNETTVLFDDDSLEEMSDSLFNLMSSVIQLVGLATTR